MTAVLGAVRRKVHRRTYQDNGLRVCVEVVSNRGVVSWFANWYAVGPNNGVRFVFGDAGNCATLRGAWVQVRNNVRTYLNGCDVLKLKGGGAMRYAEVPKCDGCGEKYRAAGFLYCWECKAKEEERWFREGERCAECGATLCFCECGKQKEVKL